MAFKNTADLREKFAQWRMDPEEEQATRAELLEATAAATLFNWTNAQAHCQGFTQYNDLDKPFTSQAVFTEGRTFFFGVYQLNTLAINVKCPGFVNNKVNQLACLGPVDLFEQFDPASRRFQYRAEDGQLQPGLNPQVLQSVLRMLCV